MSTTTALIRPYAPSDKEAVLSLLRLNTPAYFATSEEGDFVHYLHHELELYYVLELNREIVGCGGINFADNKTHGRISWDMFHPAHQGKGLGSQLTRFRINRLKEMDGIRLISVRTSQLAFQFYEKLGFELKESVKDYWAPGFDMYRMEIVQRHSAGHRFG